MEETFFGSLTSLLWVVIVLAAAVLVSALVMYVLRAENATKPTRREQVLFVLAGLLAVVFVNLSRNQRVIFDNLAQASSWYDYD